MAMAVFRSRTTLSVMALLLIWGLWSRAVIPVAAEPEVSLPIFSVQTAMDGVSGEDVERLITRPMEDELLELEWLKDLRSYSRVGISVVIAEFYPDVDLRAVEYEMRKAVDTAQSELPESALDPVLTQFSAKDFPLLTLSIFGPGVPKRVLYEVGEELSSQLGQLPQVLEANTVGIPDQVVEITVDRLAIEAYGLVVSDVFNLVLANDVIVPAGAQDSGNGKFEVKIPAAVDSIEELESFPIKRVGDRIVRFRDVASLRPTFKELSSLTRFDGNQGIGIEIVKALDANDIDTVESVRRVLEVMRPQIPPRIEVKIAQDNSLWAVSMISELTGNVATAIAVIMTIVVAALGFGSGILVGISVPFCFMIGFGVLNYLDLAFNFMVMFGLLLSMGMLIDGSIVVVEYAKRLMAEGIERRKAFTLAAERMALPIIASTGTTVFAFFPLMFWPGITGRFMFFLPVTVFAVLSASLIYCLYFLPTLGSVSKVLGGGGLAKADLPDAPSVEADAPSVSSADIDILPPQITWANRTYHWLIKGAIASPLFVILLITSVLLCITSIYFRFGKGIEYFTEAEVVHALIRVQSRDSLALREMEDVVKTVEERILAFPEVQYTSSSIGNSQGGFFGTVADQIALIFVELKDGRERSRKAQQIWVEMQEDLVGIPGVLVSLSELAGGPPVGSALEIEVLSNERESGRIIAGKLRNFLRGHRYVGTLTDDLSADQLEWQIEVDREKASALGVSIQEIGAVVQMTTRGLKVTEFRPEGSRKSVDVNIRFPEEQRRLVDLSNLQVPTRAGTVPVSSVAQLIPRLGSPTITRLDGRYHVGLGVDLTPEAAAAGVTARDLEQVVRDWEEQQTLPQGTYLQMGGAAEELEATTQYLTIASFISFMLMLILLVTQFNSFYQAFLILSAVLMSFAGVFLLFLLTGKSFSVVMGGMGLVTLAGIVVNNNIVFIDTFNHLRRLCPDLSIDEIALRTAMQRVRPVLLTTLTTVFGLLPLALGLSIDLINRDIQLESRVAVYWKELSATLVSGLTFSTVLTLFFTPAALVLPSRVKSFIKVQFDRVLGRSKEEMPQDDQTKVVAETASDQL